MIDFAVVVLYFLRIPKAYDAVNGHALSEILSPEPAAPVFLRRSVFYAILVIFPELS